MKQRLLIVEDDCLMAEAAADKELSSDSSGCDDAKDGWICSLSRNPKKQ